MYRRAIARACLLLALGPATVFAQSPAAGWNLQPQPLAVVPPGTKFLDAPPEGWSHIVLLVESRIARGDVEAVSSTIAHYSQIFRPVVLANVATGDDGQHWLEKVAIGFATEVDGQHVVVSSETAQELGAELGFIGGQVLRNNEQMLDNFVEVARSPANLVFDAPAMMLWEDRHVEMTMRLAIWVAPASGRLGTAVWLLEDTDDAAADYRLVQETFQFLPENMKEDRELNVKQTHFTFGIPGKKAFAMVRIPQGTPFQFTESLRKYAVRRKFTAAGYRSFWAALAEALHQSQ